MDALPEHFLPVEALPWSDAARQAVEEQRTLSPEGRLFVDRLLESCLGPESSRYPPQGPAGLRLLLRRVEDSETAPTFLKRCLELYLLLDYRDDQRTANFLAQAQLPAKYARTMTGYHLLDEGRLTEAVGKLASAGDDLDHLPHVLTRLALDPQSLVRFVRLARPTVTDPWNIFELIRAFTLQGSVAEAWRWMRKLPLDPALEPNRTDGVRLVLSTAFADDGTSQPIPVSLQTLISYPFEGVGEDAAVWAYCNEPPTTISGKNRDLLVSWAVARLSAEGRHAEAFALLKRPNLAPSSGEATAQRQLLRRSLETVLSKVHTAVDALLKEPEEPPGTLMETDVDLAATPWAVPEPKAPMTAPKSLIQAKANEELKGKKPAAPAALPPSATPSRRSILPTSASPFRPPPTSASHSTAKRTLSQHDPRRTFSPAPSTLRQADFSPAASPDPVALTPSIAPLGPRRPPEAVVKPAAVRESPQSKVSPPNSRVRTAEREKSSVVEDQSVRRTKGVNFPGAFGIEEDAMEEDFAAEQEPQQRSAPSPPKRNAKASRSKTATNLAEMADEPEPSPARSTRKSKTMTGLSTLDQKDEEPPPDTLTPRRSKRLSVQPRTAAPEVPKSTRTTKKGGRAKG